MADIQYIIPVDFKDFKPTEFHSQWVGTTDQGVEGCFLVVTRVPPGTGTSAVHTHLGDQFYFIFEGEMNLQLADETMKAKADDLIYIPTAVPHKNFNSTDKDEIHWEFIVPGDFPGLQRFYRAQWPAYELKEVPTNPHYVRSLDRSKFDPNKKTNVTMADYDSGSHHARIDIVQVPRGQGEGDVHVSPYAKVLYTMTGQLDVQIGRKRHTVAPNTYVYLPTGTPHTYVNSGQGYSTHIEVRMPPSRRDVDAVPVNLDL
jgi:mannose-6-phosphate isomerase-like protein (cupin superfamily)